MRLIHLVVCLTTGSKPLPKRALHIVWSRASSFKWEYPLLSLRSSNSFLRLLPCLPVTYIPPCIFPSVTRCRRQFRPKMLPIQFAFRLRISCRIFLCSLTLSNTSYARCLSYFLVIMKQSGYKFCSILTHFKLSVKMRRHIVLYGRLQALLMHASILVDNLTYFSAFSPDRLEDGAAERSKLST